MTTTESPVTRSTAVWMACNAMAKRGEKPTMRLVRASGVPGSPKDIQNDVNEWFAHVFKSHTAALAAEGIPKTLHETLSKLWEMALGEAATQFNTERTELQQQIAAAEAVVEQKDALLEQTNQTLTIRNQQLESATATNDGLRDQLSAANQSQAKLEQERQELAQALNDKRSELDTERREGDAAKAFLAEAHRKELQSANETHAQATEILTQTHAKAINQLNSTIESQNNRIFDLESKLADQRASAKKEEDLLRAELKSINDELRTALAQASAANAELMAMKLSNDQYQKQLADTQALLEKSIQSIAALNPPTTRTTAKKAKASPRTSRKAGGDAPRK